MHLPRLAVVCSFGVLLMLGLPPVGADDADTILGDAAGLFDETEETEPQGEALLSGYVENNARLLQKRGDPQDWTVQNAGKVKIRVSASDGRLKAYAEISGLYYAGLTELDASEFLPDSLGPVVSGVPPLMFEDTVEVAQAYAAAPVGPFVVTVGRQPLALGTGYAWNPVDPFTTKDSREPTYEVTSLDAIKLATPLPLNGEMRAAVILGQDATGADNLSATMSTRVNVLFDWEASFSTHYTKRTDPVSGFRLTARENVLGLATSGQLGELGAHGESAWVFSDQDGDHLRALVGVDYTFEFQNSLLVEGLFDGRGDNDGYSTESWLSYAAGEVPVLGRFYLYGSTVQTVLDSVSLELGALVNANDPSALLLPAIGVSFSEIVEFRLAAAIGVGDGRSEFGVVPPLIEFRATAYF